jgi:hypothetical protein
VPVDVENTLPLVLSMYIDIYSKKKSGRFRDADEDDEE